MSNPRERKPNRLQHYDYSMPGAYFITICCKDRKKYFWEDVGASIARPTEVRLSPYGLIVERAIQCIPIHYPMISVDHYVVMPNHVHMLLQIQCGAEGKQAAAPTISVVVQQMKGAVTKEIGFSVWQKLFHDHVIRDQRDYDKIWCYIENNPVNWTKDCFFAE